ncbi:MAG: hypothetical protein P8047_10160 [Gammaproteobacteria bacterium]
MNAIVQEQDDIYLQIERCQGRIEIYQGEIKKLESDLQDVEKQLEEFADERRKYELLITLSSNLEQLAEMGAIRPLPVRVMVMPWTKKDEDEKR